MAADRVGAGDHEVEEIGAGSGGRQVVVRGSSGLNRRDGKERKERER